MKVVTFNIGDTVYSVKIDVIKEIMIYPKRVANLPNQNKNVIGVTNIRGTVSTIIDIERLLTNNTCSDKKFLIILENKNGKIICFPTSNMPETLDITNNKVDTNFVGVGDLIEGVTNTKKGLVVMLDDKKLFE